MHERICFGNLQWLGGQLEGPNRQDIMKTDVREVGGATAVSRSEHGPMAVACVEFRESRDFYQVINTTSIILGGGGQR